MPTAQRFETTIYGLPDESGHEQYSAGAMPHGDFLRAKLGEAPINYYPFPIHIRPGRWRNELAQVVREHFHRAEWTDEEALTYGYAWYGGSVVDTIAEEVARAAQMGRTLGANLARRELNGVVVGAHFGYFTPRVGPYTGYTYFAVLHADGTFAITRERVGTPSRNYKRPAAVPGIVTLPG